MSSFEFEVCPETGIGCLLMNKDGQSVKVDLMPDETANLRAMAVTGNTKGAKSLLAEINSDTEEMLDEDSLKELIRELK